ncbi:unnamed protein product [Cuscuta campestris]|uniref:Uncharacterized protein n=1 Tax=Cuscuta campestris TaxID=132261 RepID=A0A484KJM5_9ASTE|nr:unnamed protein product [Cuscuta campestris]
MHLMKSHHHHYYYSPKTIFLLSSSLLAIFLLSSFLLLPDSTLSFLLRGSASQRHAPPPPPPLSLRHVVFGIASNANSWRRRKEYVKLWWRPAEMRGCVFLERENATSASDNDTALLPPVCVSGDTSRFRYTYGATGKGTPSAIRVARVVSETVALNHTGVRWFVFGDDDTVFFPENLVKTLSKYDHGLWYYIGANSESHAQNKFFSYGMAFGGAGFAISYPLAKVLARVLDSCLERYPHLYGSDARIHACLSELGISLTLEPGFHQLDVQGNVFGLLAAHPVRPLVSLHHMDVLFSIFPHMTIIKSLRHLYAAAAVDPHRILQQTVCYDRWFSWTVSVSWGYAVQVFGNHVRLPEALRVQQSYMPWKKGGRGMVYDFDTWDFNPDPCRRQPIFFFTNASSAAGGGGGDRVSTVYRKMTKEKCRFDLASPRKLEEIKVHSHKLVLDRNQLLAPRRQCCDVLASTSERVMEIEIRECKEDEITFLQQ